MSWSGGVQRLGLWLAMALCLGCSRPTPTPASSFVSTEPPLTATLPVSTRPAEASSTLTPTPDTPWIVDSVALLDLPGQGESPRDLVGVGGRLYVVNSESANVSVIKDERVLATIPAGAEPIAVAANATRESVYVLDERQHQVLVIEGEAIVDRWSVPAGAGSLAVVGDALWIGTGDGRLVALSLGGGDEVRTISLSDDAPVLRIVADPADHTRAAVVTYGHIHLVALDAGVEIGTTEVGIWRALAYAHDGARLYAGVYDAQSQRHRLTLLDADDLTRLGQAELPSSPRAVLADATGERIYLALPEEHAVLALTADGLKPMWQATVGREPVAMMLAGGILHVACAGSDQVARVDGLTGERLVPIPLATHISDLAVAQDGILATLSSADQAVMLGADGVSARWRTQPHPQRLAWLPEQARVAVLSSAAGALTLHELDGTPVGQHDVGTESPALFYDDAHGLLYAGSIALDLATGLTRTVTVTTPLDTQEAPALVAVDRARDITYLVAGNGVLGSNYGLIAYQLLADGTTALGGPGRLSIVDLLYDVELDLFYSIYGHMGVYGLQAWDPATESERWHLSLVERPVDLALNPETYHLWVALSRAVSGGEAGKGTLRAYDTRSMGLAAEFAFPGAITAMAVDAETNRVFAACDEDQAVWVVQDVAQPAAPAPVPALDSAP